MYVWRRKKKVVEQLNTLVLRLGKAPLPAPQPTAAPTPKAVSLQFRNTNIAVRSDSIDALLGSFEARKNASQAQTPQVSAVKRVLDEVKLREAWREYAESLNRTEEHIKSQMDVVPKVVDGHIEVTTLSQAQADGLMSNTLLKNYLRHVLGCDIQIVARMDESQNAGKEVVFTAQQKLNKFKEMNSSLEKFIEQFALQVEL